MRNFRLKSYNKVSYFFVIPLFFSLNSNNCFADDAEAGKEVTKGLLTAFEVGRYQFCGKDSDCMVAVNGCCDCANGGETVAVNKDRFKAFRERFDCVGVACTLQASFPRCDGGVVSCVDRKCKYVSQEEVDETLGNTKKKPGK